MIDNVPNWLESLDNHEPAALSLLLRESRPQTLAPLVDQWVTRKSSWAVSEQVRYFQAGVVPRGHRVVVRRLIRAAAEHQHDQVMAAAMVFADYVRDTSAFTASTAAYLQRFTWRYMRSIAKSRPDDYCRTLATSLRAYPSTMNNWSTCLRRWCLLKACYAKHRALKFSSTGVSLQPRTSVESLERSRGEMAYRELWDATAGQTQLHRLVLEARSPIIRDWATMQLR